jgi:hypothetical protein
MSAAASTLNLFTLFVRYLWSRRQPHPSWTGGDFHVNPLPPASKPGTNPAVPTCGAEFIDQDATEMYPHFGSDSKDEPPTWSVCWSMFGCGADRPRESLNIDSALRPSEKEWSRADGALETIEEKRASLVKDGYAV